MNTKRTFAIVGILALLAGIVRAAESILPIPPEATASYYRAGEFNVSAFYQNTTTDFDGERGAAGVSVGYYLTQNIGADVSTALGDTSGTFIDDITVRGLYRIPIARHAFYFFAGGTRHLEAESWGIVLGPGVEVRITPSWGLFSEVGIAKELTGDRDAAAQVRLGGKDFILKVSEMLPEREVRQLRANIYGECSDRNWEACRENWLRSDSVQWLIEHQPKW